MKLRTYTLTIALLLLIGTSLFAERAKEQLSANGITSIETAYTISKVRTAKKDGSTYLLASSYEGTVLAVSYSGKVLWENQLSGFMNHDVWCEDLTNDGSDEILLANADGTIYCLDDKGKLIWSFKKNNAPMYGLCVIRKNNTPYVVCGGFDKNIYYLSAKGELVKEIPSSLYSIEKPWGKKGYKRIPESNNHTANFLRKIKNADGSEQLCVHGIVNSMSASGSLYLFDALEDRPSKIIKLKKGGPFGDLRVVQSGADKRAEILLGSSGAIKNAVIKRVDLESSEQVDLPMSKLANKKVGHFGYRVVQTERISNGEKEFYFCLFGNSIILLTDEFNKEKAEVLKSKFSFNDMWKDESRNLIVLASSQSGGSCIHVIDPTNLKWKKAYRKLTPPGKISSIISNTNVVKEQVADFKRPDWEREPLPVYLMTEKITPSLENMVRDINMNKQSPVFLNGLHMSKIEKWDRSVLGNQVYEAKRDRRKKYVLSSNEVLDFIRPELKDAPGIAYWGGHGNDPFLVSLATQKRIVDEANGKFVVSIYPELEQYDVNFKYVLDNHFYPLAEYYKGKNAKLYIRTKHTFWQTTIYKPLWSRLMSGEFADVFVPSMEETTDKSMELSLASRMGVWASGAVDSWGARCARDNASFDRSRQHSHQMLPNHFLRTLIYNISNGAQYINNFAVDQEYMSLLWDLIAKGALYVPKRDEILSFSPVHLSMKDPDMTFLDEGSNVKWTTFYNQEFEENNAFVFSRLNGTWPGAPLTEWDFSRYAAGAKERRLNFMPTYENGLVLITPVQKGKFFTESKRGQLADHLHPIYKNILKEYITDGRYYYSADGEKKYNADEYYKVIEEDIKKSASLLPLTVSGDVAWVVAQTDSKYLRLTLIDKGYVNPKDRKAIVKFSSIKIKQVKDILSGEMISISDDSTASIEIPCGAFRFIDIELEDSLSADK
ncbi:outer membrane protein assembly factor BamB family protein [Labilibaculum antarcticum]|uniref:Lambda-carrageenase n=1 Tax=Labilibaculum antarcticum TaxID=1717717 RepID=A0A1Y1CMB8_9BACT|nr:PQQ-binding-like beta-propeller repeat protein [Labilibaculum antarcticum]BAX81102.1 hypothetical protein ALGA_2790 [Labilibaculum antarcticum]